MSEHRAFQVFVISFQLRQNPVSMKTGVMLLTDIRKLLCVLYSLCFFCRADDARQPLSRIVPIPSNQLNLYRLVIILRLIILCFFFQYRITHPVRDAYPLWLTSVICEIWFALSWLLDQFPKWYPINRETYLERLALRSVFLLLFLSFQNMVC